ncbi:hypothetical protein CTA2_12546 [Colletotrichum tanaceti]|nr:hypothetical protein CTA2_12546 [Colletotrichum tanaceti]
MTACQPVKNENEDESLFLKKSKRFVLALPIDEVRHAVIEGGVVAIESRHDIVLIEARHALAMADKHATVCSLNTSPIGTTRCTFGSVVYCAGCIESGQVGQFVSPLIPSHSWVFPDIAYHQSHIFHNVRFFRLYHITSQPLAR